MKFISLFSGIGGFDLGFERAGMECAAQVEFDSKAQSVLKHHWPKVLHFGDVRHVGKHNLPAADLICGGFPCQDVSVAGRRAGLAGERSGLWFEFLRIVTECAPRWVVIENVPGLLSSNRGRDFATVIHGLVKCGYRVGWRVLDAQYFGLAQRRKRVFIIASLAAAGANPAEILFERESSQRNTPPSRETRQGTTTYAIKGAAIGRKPENGPQFGEILKDDTCYTLNTSEFHAVASALPASGAGTARTGNERTEASFLVPVSHTLSAPAEYKEGIGTLRASGGDIGGGSEMLIANVTYALKSDITPKWSKEIAPTLRTPSPSGGGHPTEVITPELAVRRLTPIECERLQGFPDNWTHINNAADSVRYKQLGNAIAVPVAEWIGKRLLQAVETNRAEKGKAA